MKPPGAQQKVRLAIIESDLQLARGAAGRQRA